MSSDRHIPQSETFLSSSSIIDEASTSYSSPADGPSNAQSSSPALDNHDTSTFPDNHGYLGVSYEAKGKRRASQEDISVSHSDDVCHLSEGLEDISIESATSTSSSSQLHSLTSGPGFRGASRQGPPPLQPPDRERRFRKGRESVSRSVAPSPLRSALNASPTTSSASQFVSLLGQPVSVSASLSAPNKNSTAATSAALPSLYKASRGRSTNVSPSRRWDRRGASATVLSGASASGSGGEGDEPSDEDTTTRQVGQWQNSDDRKGQPSSRSSSRRLLIPREEALFPSDDDDDDSPPFSPTEKARDGPLDQIAKHRRRSRRWSSTERDRQKGMRILLQEHKSELQDSVETLRVSGLRASGRGRTRSATRTNSANEEDGSDPETSSLPSSCNSSCDLNHVPSRSRAESVAIPIKEGRSRRSSLSGGAHNASVSVASSLGQVPSSTDGSGDHSPAASTPSTSLIQRSPPGFTALKPMVAVPVLSDSDPLLGLSTPSVEDLIQVDQVEYFPEEAITAQLISAKVKRKTSPKRSKKSSWIIGDFESEPESDEEPKPSKASLDSAVDRRNVTAISSSTPSSSPSSYQARLASLQSQLRIWSRTQDAPAQSRVRQISSGSEDQADAEADVKEGESNGASLLSASWRNLTRLPNLILLPGLAARQTRESLAPASKAHTGGPDGSNADAAAPLASSSDFAQIYRRASHANQGFSDEKTLQAQRDVALKTGRPPSPSPSPSPPASLLGSRQSSNDSISTTDRVIQAHSLPGAPRRGRGVASPLEADRDPSAYVSGLGQPIDPDTELSSVVQLQTFRSRSRSRPAEVGQRGRTAHQPRSASPRHSADTDGHDLRRGKLSPKKLGQPVELNPTHEETMKVSSGTPAKAAGQSSACTAKAPELLTVQIPTPAMKGSLARPRLGRHDVFGEGPKPTDTASAPTSPTYRKETSSSSATTSGDEADSVPSPPSQGRLKEDASLDVDGFRVVRRRHRRKSSGPKSLRPKVDALVPQGYSAFAIDENDEAAEGGESDGETTPSPTPARRSRARRGRASSPHRSTRQCAVGLFGGGMPETHSSSSKEILPSSSRSRHSGRRDGSQISISTPVRSVRSSPDLTYAAAAAVNAAGGGDLEGEEQTKGDPSPPRGSRGRRGAVKVVASSVGQRAPPPQPLLLSGMEGLRRGPSYPPRAGERFEDGAAIGSEALEEEPSSSTSGHAARGGRGRSASSPTCGNASPQPLRFRLLSNSSHLLMLSLELDMIKKQKISAPLKPRWGKHRANDFNPLPSTISYASSAALSATSKYLRSPFSASRDGKEVDGGDDAEAEAGECQDGRCSPCDQVGSQVELAAPSLTIGTAAAAVAVHRPATSSMATGLRNPSSRLRYSWSVADIASVLDAAASV